MPAGGAVFHRRRATPARRAIIQAIGTGGRVEPLEAASSARPWVPAQGLWRPGVERWDRATAAARAAIERALGVTEAARLYEAAQRRDEPSFSDRALATLNVCCDIRGDVERIPAAGPLVVVANHPFGAADGLMLASILGRRRADVRCLATRLLERVPEAHREMFLVDTAGGPAAAARNHRPMRRALSWVRGGGCLCVFPAGDVSHVTHRRWAVHDGPWHGSIARLVRATDATVLPCFIEGANSWMFQALGLLHPSLRTLLLVRELLRLRDRTVRVHVGEPIPVQALPRRIDELTASLRARTDALPKAIPARRARPVSIEDEVRALAPERSLASAGGFRVFWVRQAEAPRLVEAIGAAREETFRAIGEGTGHAVDLDAFDRDYVHLCVWDDRAHALAGAYRMTAVSAPATTPDALYTGTLFRFDARLTRALSPGLELGRAFVRPAYQKQFAPLMLLWTGIGRYLAGHAEARYLFGAVSLSASYSPAARDLLIAFLERHACDRTLAGLVEARHPVPRGAVEDRIVPADVSALEAAVAASDREGKGVPVLLRQYLKLGARAIASSVDPAFGHSVDVLMVVDLLAMPEAALKRYLGAERARALAEKLSGEGERRAG
jgi:putative hemolysin